ncbi:hypothetical protein [Sphingomonas kyeonggiensis]|uniref:Uncharacterized protein n=1 Tax=Sphingomonas kyeonggiensis TaxID=1268553 RepID=A0A7W6NVB4_9SPHN|nr:hypothetical protein [Sphingomonas kyeonggiensis]MBB4096953.1 hypothetical protein [Sphingomonas kyeonggiensis]
MKTALKIAGLFAVLAANIALPAQAAMHGRQEYVVVFYSDESHTSIVGQNVFYCDGHIVRVGVPSLESEEIYYGCD